MKKLSKIFFALLFAFCFCLPFVALSDTKACAEELPTDEVVEEEVEEPTEDENETSNGENDTTNDETITDEETNETVEKVVLTKEELQELINSALTESQKNFIDKISALVSEKFNLAKGNVALIISLIVLVGGIFVVFIIKYISKKRKIAKDSVEKQALADEAQVYKKQVEEYSKLLETLSKSNFADVIEKSIKELEDDIFNNLKLDKETVGKLLKSIDIETTLIQHIVNALKVVCAKSGLTGALNELSTAPETAILEQKEYENAKLKEALGEEAVKKILG